MIVATLVYKVIVLQGSITWTKLKDKYIVEVLPM